MHQVIIEAFKSYSLKALLCMFLIRKNNKNSIQKLYKEINLKGYCIHDRIRTLPLLKSSLRTLLLLKFGINVYHQTTLPGQVQLKRHQIVNLYQNWLSWFKNIPDFWRLWVRKHSRRARMPCWWERTIDGLWNPYCAHGKTKTLHKIMTTGRRLVAKNKLM